MSEPRNLVIKINNDDELRVIKNVLSLGLKEFENQNQIPSDIKLAHDLTNSVMINLSDQQSQFRLRIGSEVAAKGNFDALYQRFKSECEMHSGSIYLEEWQNGKYEIIRSRRCAKTSSL